jgi:hypothetical protein
MKFLNKLRVVLGIKPVYKVTINYKSGKSVVIRCTEFKTKRSGGELTEVEYTLVEGVGILFIGIDNIESIYTKA